MMRGIDPVTLMAVASFCALLWVASALHKLSNWQDYREQLRDYQIAPLPLQAGLAILLVLVEVLLALAWLADARSPWVALASAFLLLCYGAAMAYNLMRGRDGIDCGCAAAGQLIRWSLVVRNLVLALLALLPMWLASAVSMRALCWLDLVTIAAAAMMLYGAYVVANQLLANNPPQRSTH